MGVCKLDDSGKASRDAGADINQALTAGDLAGAALRADAFNTTDRVCATDSKGNSNSEKAMSQISKDNEGKVVANKPDSWAPDLEIVGAPPSPSKKK
jgi:hypothetical protein